MEVQQSTRNDWPKAYQVNVHPLLYIMRECCEAERIISTVSAMNKEADSMLRAANRRAHTLKMLYKPGVSNPGEYNREMTAVTLRLVAAKLQAFAASELFATVRRSPRLTHQECLEISNGQLAKLSREELYTLYKLTGATATSGMGIRISRYYDLSMKN